MFCLNIVAHLDGIVTVDYTTYWLTEIQEDNNFFPKMKSMLNHFRSSPNPSSPSSFSISQAPTQAQHVSGSVQNSSLAVIELFQSQGCNSCPPTNANLLELTADASSLLLTYHVTYWDYLGWRDTFGNKAFDERQRDYVRRLGLRSAGTPQVSVNGRASGVGNSKSALDRILKDGGAGENLPVAIRAERDSASKDVVIKVSFPEPATTGRYLEVWVVRYDPSSTNVDIKRGENRGKVLPHRNVVKSVQRVGDVRAGEEGVLVIEQGDDRLESAVLIQDGAGGRIVGAARV